jgi:hypothetical protein
VASEHVCVVKLASNLFILAIMVIRRTTIFCQFGLVSRWGALITRGRRDEPSSPGRADGAPPHATTAARALWRRDGGRPGASSCSAASCSVRRVAWPMASRY